MNASAVAEGLREGVHCGQQARTSETEREFGIFYECCRTTHCSGWCSIFLVGYDVAVCHSMNDQ
jgi:hypothetical protein